MCLSVVVFPPATIVGWNKNSDCFELIDLLRQGNNMALWNLELMNVLSFARYRVNLGLVGLISADRLVGSLKSASMLEDDFCDLARLVGVLCVDSRPKVSIDKLNELS